MARLEALLSDGDFYRKDRVRFEATTVDLAKIRLALTKSENRWLELEGKSEELRAKIPK